MTTYNSRRVLDWRQSHEMTQAQAARCVGVDPNTWARWERGERDVPPTALRLLLALDRLWKHEPDAFRG